MKYRISVNNKKTLWRIEESELILWKYLILLKKEYVWFSHSYHFTLEDAKKKMAYLLQDGGVDPDDFQPI